MGRLVVEPSTKVTSLLRRLYNTTSSPAGYSGVENLYREAHRHDPQVTRRQVEEFLQADSVYSTYRPRRVHYPRLRSIPAGYMTHMHVDLAQMDRFADANDGYKYILVAVEMLSRMVYVVPVRNKTATSMRPAFDRLFVLAGGRPWVIFSDKGTEFCSKEMLTYFSEHEVLKHTGESGDTKASLSERQIRTLKQRLYRYFAQHSTHRWVDVIGNIASAMNHSRSRVTGMRPVDVNERNADALWHRLYGREYTHQQAHRTAPRFAVDDIVRIDRQKGAFEKGYTPNFTSEKFRVASVREGRPTTYRLKDLAGEPITAHFFNENFSRTRLNDTELATIQRVLRIRKRGGRTEYLVKLEGGGGDKTRWISDEELFDTPA